MAKGKKKDEALLEEPQVNTENVENEATEQPAEEINEAPAEEITETDAPAEEITETDAPAEEITETDAPANDAEEQAPEDKGEELIEKAEDLLNGKEEIEDAIINNDADTAKELLQSELDKAEDIKAEIEEDIKKREANIKKKGLDPKKLFSRRFGGFWNGVSSGWED